MGSALMGSLQISMWFDRGTFWVLPLTYFCLPKGARTYLFFHNLSKLMTFAAAPLVLTPFVRNRRPIDDLIGRARRAPLTANQGNA